MKKLLIHIWAYDYHTKFEILAEDNVKSIENSILDKLGEKSVKWESTGMFKHLRRITYEEVINDTRPIHYKEGLGVRMATRAHEGGQI